MPHWIIFLPLIVFEGSLFVLTVNKLVQHIFSPAHYRSDLLGVLLYDSVVYFAGALVVLLANSILYIICKVCLLQFY